MNTLWNNISAESSAESGWSATGGYSGTTTFGSTEEAESWAGAFQLQQANGGGGKIVPTTTPGKNSYASGTNSNGQPAMWIVYGSSTTTYTYVPASFSPYNYVPDEIPSELRPKGSSEKDSRAKDNIVFIWDTNERETHKDTPARTIPIIKKDKNTQIAIYLHESVRKMSEGERKLKIGHEWIHVAQIRKGSYAQWFNRFGKLGARNISETKGWLWEMFKDPNDDMLQNNYRHFQEYNGQLPSGYSLTPGFFDY